MGEIIASENISCKVQGEPSIQPYSAHKRTRKGCGFFSYLCNISINVIVEYSDVELASCNGSIKTKYSLRAAVGYSDVKVASCHSGRKITCFCEGYFRIY